MLINSSCLACLWYIMAILLTWHGDSIASVFIAEVLSLFLPHTLTCSSFLLRKVEALQNVYVNTPLSYAYHNVLSLCYCSQGEKVPFSRNLSGRYKIPSWQTHPAPSHLQHCSIINRCTERMSRLMDDGLSAGILQAQIWQVLRTHTRADSVKTEQRFKVKYAQRFWVWGGVGGGGGWGEDERRGREREKERGKEIALECISHPLTEPNVCVHVCGLIWLWGSLHWRPLESRDAVCCECCCKLFH